MYRTTLTIHYKNHGHNASCTIWFTCMLFGVDNPQSTFQQAIDVIQSTVKWHLALVYLQDIFIFSNRLLDYLSYLYSVFDLLFEARMRLKLNEWFVLEDKIDYLRPVKKTRNPCDLDKGTEASFGLNKLINMTHLQSFLSLCNLL